MKHRWLLLLLPALCACAQKRREVSWPAPDPRDRCYAGHASGAAPPGEKAAIIIQPKGALTYRDVLRVFGNQGHDFKGCYAAGLPHRPGLSGRVQLRFTVGREGEVLRWEIEYSALHFPEVEDCLGRTVCRWRFAAPTTGEATVSFPFVISTGSPDR